MVRFFIFVTSFPQQKEKNIMIKQLSHDPRGSDKRPDRHTSRLNTIPLVYNSILPTPTPPWWVVWYGMIWYGWLPHSFLTPTAPTTLIPTPDTSLLLQPPSLPEPCLLPPFLVVVVVYMSVRLGISLAYHCGKGSQVIFCGKLTLVFG